MGQSAPMTYFALDVAPGEHQIACLAESNSTVAVNLKKGDVAYVWQEMKMGMMSAGCKVQKVDEATGKKGVTECKRAVASY